MAFQFVAFALIALIIVFLVERVYRKLQENERGLEMLSRKFIILDERYQKQAKLLKYLAKNAEIDKNESKLMKQCPRCKNHYASNLPECPFCSG